MDAAEILVFHQRLDQKIDRIGQGVREIHDLVTAVEGELEGLRLDHVAAVKRSKEGVLFLKKRTKKLLFFKSYW